MSGEHLRGYVFKRGGTWHMQVNNIETGRLVASDNTNSLPVMQDAALCATIVAREAWLRGMRRKDLKRAVKDVI